VEPTQQSQVVDSDASHVSDSEKSFSEYESEVELAEGVAEALFEEVR